MADISGALQALIKAEEQKMAYEQIIDRLYSLAEILDRPIKDILTYSADNLDMVVQRFIEKGYSREEAIQMALGLFQGFRQK